MERRAAADKGQEAAADKRRRAAASIPWGAAEAVCCRAMQLQLLSAPGTL